MSTIIAGYATLEKLKEIVNVLEGRGDKGFKFTVSVSDESNEWDQNVAFFAEQTKEQRENKIPRYYFGNGRVIWTDGKIVTAKKKDAVAQVPSNSDLEKPLEGDAPF